MIVVVEEPLKIRMPRQGLRAEDGVWFLFVPEGSFNWIEEGHVIRDGGHMRIVGAE